jgi:gliding motility-associated-like protein
MSNQNSGSYTFTPSAGQCATGPVTVSVTVIAPPSGNGRSDTAVYDGATVPSYVPTGSPAGVSFTWTNSNPAIGLPASGSGNVPSFTGTNMTPNPISGTITVTPVINGCAGASRTYIITILPLYKDIFVPTVFSPNGDGKNDLLFAYSNYIVKLEMRIFNQWGQEIVLITSRNQGWDGKYKGKPQPVGVYAYALQAVMTDGRTVKMKGSITLLR